MKNIKTKLGVGVIGLLGLGTILLSFDNATEPKFKKYEVIRSVNGEVQTYDTLVSANSDFTPENYLELLGFENDEAVNIIHLGHPGSEMDFKHMDNELKLNSDSVKVVHIEMMNDKSSKGNEEGHVVIKNNVVIRETDELEQDIMEVEKIIEIINLDSIINMNMDNKGNSSNVVIQKIVINDSDEKLPDLDWEVIEGEPTFERHTVDGNSKCDLMLFGEGKDFTMVIVTDESEITQKSQVKIEKSNAVEGQFKVYPNPANKEVAVQLNFEERANTSITVSDNQGKVVLEMDLGLFSGNYNQIIDVSKWAKGIYYVNVTRPNTKLVEKLVVE